MANGKKIQNLQVWLLDDHASRFSGAHITATESIDTREKWLSMVSHVSDLIGDVNCVSGSTDGLYILSSHDHINNKIKDVLMTRVHANENTQLQDLTLPIDTVGILSLVTRESTKYGVLTLHQKALKSRRKDTLVFRIPTIDRSKQEVDGITKLALLALSQNLHGLLAKA